MQTGYLEPKFEGVKSYYKKARVYTIFGSIYLKSYDETVCTIRYKTDEYGRPLVDESTGQLIKEIEINWCYSKTTNRHIKEFLKQYFDNPYIKIERIKKGTYKYIDGELLSDE